MSPTNDTSTEVSKFDEDWFVACSRVDGNHVRDTEKCGACVVPCISFHLHHGLQYRENNHKFGQQEIPIYYLLVILKLNKNHTPLLAKPMAK